METYKNQIKYNDDSSVNVPFGRAVKCRQVTPKLVKAGILMIEYVQRAIDYLALKTKTGTRSSILWIP
ncbi:unnamed protein product [Rhizophagus irregularis]|nr:unnamed protein product [Rhizophagus irregularis]